MLKAGSGAILRFCTGWLEKPVVEPKIRPVVEPNVTLLTVQTVCVIAHRDVLVNSFINIFLQSEFEKL